MKRRKKMGRKRSRRDFTKKAVRVHKFNNSARAMRGGIRL